MVVLQALLSLTLAVSLIKLTALDRPQYAEYTEPQEGTNTT